MDPDPVKVAALERLRQMMERQRAQDLAREQERAQERARAQALARQARQASLEIRFPENAPQMKRLDLD